jgi:hypothetical protein
MSKRPTVWVPIALWLICAACLAWQIFVPPFIGEANNGDFGKVSGHLSLAPVDGGDSNFVYFQPDWLHAKRNEWHSPYTSSEMALAWTALHLSGAAGENARFDIRWLGAVHALLFLAAFALLLRWHPLIAVAAMLAFTDVCYVAYLNSFYMDTAAVCGLLLQVVAACWIAVTDEPSPAQIVACGLAALLYATSKTQHALWSLLPAAFLAATGWRCRRTLTRGLAFGAAAAVLIAAVLLFATADRTNPAQAIFNKLFFQLGVAPGGSATLLELGVQPTELHYIGTHSYVPGSPANDRDWVEAFAKRTGYGRLAGWYLRHPGRAFGLLWDTLAKDAPEMRQNNLSNFRRQDGHPAAARTTQFAVWSDLRSTLTSRWPWHMVLWYVLFVAGGILVLRAPRFAAEARLAWIGLGIALMGAGQFAVAALADCLETGRHLFLFNACTDVMFCLAVAYLVSRRARA